MKIMPQAVAMGHLGMYIPFTKLQRFIQGFGSFLYPHNCKLSEAALYVGHTLHAVDC